MIMREVVLDTNCLIRMLPAVSPYHCLWNDFIIGKYTLCVSNEILNEYQEIIERLTTPGIARDVVAAIARSPHIRYCETFYRFRLIEADPDDNKFVDCAITAGADYIVSEDAHFRVLSTISFPSVNVILLDQFVDDLYKS